ncbi:DUF1778 domain-containing protein [Pseudidiomarina donghaiensis]|uniref:DUF1778 domain-containing protein n=1 Tax=Pseudidiomarina donghaiensis TaxID=519452 RepID=A0A432XGT6_9GAMM|nr:DUF1778 domain-containing protein [Pseudidiomarina donghaiensis]RUO47931.1 DUF1778 domain-containing protein [Pseudidiomarina donghaiensis]SFV22645.1 Uncharacterized conserved protein, DUF1778 family [Pseudidiomarina donghaiensis]
MHSAKSARIELKTTPEVKRELEQAAALSGVTLTSFIINQAHTEARRVTTEQNVVRLNQQAWSALSQAINEPAQPTDALKDLMKR